MEVTELTTKEIHDETLKIMKVIDSICQKEKLNYTLFYGTLIGAIRHKGFIPWDDDLDIVMPRPDYDKLEAYFIEHEKELNPYKLFSYKTVPAYPFMINRICNTEFDYRGKNEVYCGMGTFIDIYPLDGFGDGSDKLLAFKSHLYSSMYYMKSRLHYEKAAGFFKNMAKHAVHFLSHFYSINMLRKRLLKCGKKYNYDESKCIICLVWDVDKTPYLKSDIQDTYRAAYEDTEFLIPKAYDKILRCSYGDYMQLPPEEERVGHHFYKIFRKED